jgi:Xaa-Pro aminopeptidase
MRDIEVAAIAEQVGHSYGSEQGIFMCASGPVGTAAVMSHRHTQNRIIREGDQFCLLVENNGPGGFYTEIGRTCVLGKASDEMKEEFDFVLRAQQHTLKMLKPGASCKEIWEAHNTFMRENGRPPEQRLYCHGQGYDMVERPLVRFDEPMRLQKNMNIALHPTYVTERTYSWVCDNFWLGESGIPERLHKLPQRIFELG